MSLPSRRTPTIAVAAALAATLAIGVGTAIAAYPYVRQASGTFTTVQNDALVSFDSKATSSGATKGSIDFYLGDFNSGSLRILGSALCSGTVDSTSAWTMYAATNVGTTDNPSFPYLLLWYRDGGKTGDGAIGDILFEIDTCAGTAAAEIAFIQSIPDGPRTIDSGNITIRR